MIGLSSEKTNEGNKGHVCPRMAGRHGGVFMRDVHSVEKAGRQGVSTVQGDV